jgi:hypothetical protein
MELPIFGLVSGATGRPSKQSRQSAFSQSEQKADPLHTGRVVAAACGNSCTASLCDRLDPRGPLEPAKSQHQRQSDSEHEKCRQECSQKVAVAGHGSMKVS